MAETNDYNPGAWKGHDFKSAYKAFDAHAGRAYADAVKDDKGADELVPKSLTTKSESPVVIICDVTGSMGEWPKTIFSKLPYLDIEGKEYLGQTMEISFAAVGDGYHDKYPLQVMPFVSGTDMEKQLKNLIVEGGGGGGGEESYDLGALYYARQVTMPNAVRPICIFIGDEGFYEFVDKEMGEKWSHGTIEGRLSTHKIFGELRQKYNVYIVRKPYGTDVNSSYGSADQVIREKWEKLLGAEHVITLPEASRVVDVIFGIFASETGKEEYFKGELTDRQMKDKDGAHKVTVVLKSLDKTIHKIDKTIKALPGPDAKKMPKGASITKRTSKDTGKTSVSLVD